MSILDTNLKELLTRFASNIIEEIPSSLITPQVEQIVSDVYKARAELHKANVLSAVLKIHPDYFNNVINNEVSDTDLLYICENNHVKNTLIEFDLKLTDSLVRQKDNPLMDWSKYAEELLGTLKPKSLNKMVFLDEINFEAERVVASYGYPTLDKWLEGGITESSYTVFYAASNIGKTQAVTVQISANLLKQGKSPLIIALEGSPQKIGTKILATLLGFADLDPRFYTPEQKDSILRLSKSMPHLPIINKGCSKRWEIEKYINIFKPDVLLYDQLTISGQGREWEKMASISEALKQIAISSGLPVIALTQSSEKNYNGKSEGGEESPDTEGTIKYSAAIFEDATHVIEIKIHDRNSPVRSFEVRKTKDDNSARQLPLKLIAEFTSAGYIERYWRSGNCIKKHDIDATTFTLNNRPVVDPILEIYEPESKPIEFEGFKSEPIIAETQVSAIINIIPEPLHVESNVSKITNKLYMKTENGNIEIDTPDLGLYSKENWIGISDRLNKVASVMDMPALKNLSDTFISNLENAPQFGETTEQEYFIKITTDEIPAAFEDYFSKEYTPKKK